MITIVDVDLRREDHAEAVVRLISEYASDAMGGGSDLTDAAKKALIPALRQRPDYFGVFAMDGDRAIGLINCFEGFSTFYAKPLINVHDVYVDADHRGLGVARRMLQRVEEVGRQRGACKLTLEVLDGNVPAVHVYRCFGFERYALDAVYGQAQFWQKVL